MRRGRPDDPQGRDPRAARRERRRQVHAGQDAVRLARTLFRRNPLERRAGDDRQPERRQEARHRHGVPAFFAVRGALGGGEHRALAQRPDADLHHRRQGAGAVLQLRPAARSLFAGRRPVGRRAPAHRDHPLPAADARTHHPRRADLGADAAGGRQAVRDAGAAALRGQVDPLHLASPRRGEAHVRRRDRDAPRQGRRPYRPAQGDRRFARAHDGRQRGACGGARAGRGHREGRAAARDQEPQPQACDALLHAAPQHLAQRAGRGGHRHRRRRRQRPGRVLRGGVGRGDAARRRHDPHPRQGRRAACRSPAAACSARPSCRRSASATARRRA